MLDLLGSTVQPVHDSFVLHLQVKASKGRGGCRDLDAAALEAKEAEAARAAAELLEQLEKEEAAKSAKAAKKKKKGEVTVISGA